ncbi:MAG: hypothetical protein BYD32DRAFT_242681 [Podila humilis]|nr:MAG: hypothetical protein BYD32DRAFT_242681 [Podila humilis]
MPSGGDDPLSKGPNDAPSDQSEDDDDEEELEIDEEDLDSFLREHNALDEHGQVIDSNNISKAQEQSHVAMDMDINQDGGNFSSHVEAQYLPLQQTIPLAQSSTTLPSTQAHTFLSSAPYGALANGNIHLPPANMIPLPQEPFLLQDAEDWMALKQREIEQQEILFRNIISASSSTQNVQTPPLSLHTPQIAPTLNSSLRHVPRPALPHTSLSFVETPSSDQQLQDEMAQAILGGDMEVDMEGDMVVSIQQQQQKQQREEVPLGQLQVPLTGLTPSIVTPEEMELLKDEIRAQTQHALNENRKFQEAIMRHLVIVQEAQDRNKALQSSEP